MNRNTQYQFIETDAEAVAALLVSLYEKFTGQPVKPASPEMLFIRWVGDVIVQERALNNYTGNQNIPSRAEGENLDALGELYFGYARPEAKAAVCQMKFDISEAQESAVLIPAGTRITDANAALVWETVEDVYVQIGETSVETQARCRTPGVIGNGYAEGQISVLVDIYDYYSGCSNITVSDGGADVPSDEEYYELMRASLDGYSTAGPEGGYAFFARNVSGEIADVAVTSPEPGVAVIYALMADGSFAGEEIKNAILEACNQDTRRPMTDLVKVEDGEKAVYNIDFTYYIQRGGDKSAAAVETDVRAAVDAYKVWQAGKFGRDINPDKLREYLFKAGVKRVELREPAFKVLSGGGISGVAPQAASAGTENIVNGGYEDE